MGDSTATSSSHGSLSRRPSSFRLRSTSLNSVRLRRVFDLFDKNGDGTITAEDIAKALTRLGMETDSDDSTLRSTIDSFAQPGNSGLTFDDFEALHKSLNDSYFDDGEVEGEEGGGSSQEETDLTEAFKVFDEDGDGYISAKELQVVLEKLGMPEAMEMERVERMIISVDRNHDGVVDFSEFKYMMRNVISRPS
ncbi:hypothetical protein V2J09_003259 [Rumex salicifolius]